VRDARSAIGTGIRRDYNVLLAFHVSFEIRTVIYLSRSQKLPNVEISCKVDTVSGEGVIWFRAIPKWMHYFKEGDDSLEDEFRPGGPRSTKYCDAIRTL
jgi:hypothetical protein